MEPRNIYNVRNLLIFVLIFYKPKLPNKYNLNGLAEIQSIKHSVIYSRTTLQWTLSEFVQLKLREKVKGKWKKKKVKYRQYKTRTKRQMSQRNLHSVH